MLSSDFLFPRFFVVPLANPSNFSHCKCFSSRIPFLFQYKWNVKRQYRSSRREDRTNHGGLIARAETVRAGQRSRRISCLVPRVLSGGTNRR